jgi:hypothetical protein
VVTEGIAFLGGCVELFWWLQAPWTHKYKYEIYFGKKSLQIYTSLLASQGRLCSMELARF